MQIRYLDSIFCQHKPWFLCFFIFLQTKLFKSIALTSFPSSFRRTHSPTKLVARTPLYRSGNGSVKSLGDIVSKHQSGNLFSVPPALSLLFFRPNRRFSSSPLKCSFSQGPCICMSPGSPGRQPAAALTTESPFETCFIGNMKGTDSAVFVCTCK